MGLFFKTFAHDMDKSIRRLILHAGEDSNYRAGLSETVDHYSLDR